MKTTLINAIILIIIFTTGANAQFYPESLPVRPYEPIKYDDLVPTWYKTSYSSWDVSDTMDGYKCFASPVSPTYFLTDESILLTEESIYQYYYRRTMLDITGTYIEKRDIKSGDLIWQTYFGYPLDEKIEAGRFIYINRYGQLEVISQLKQEPYDVRDLISGNNSTKLSRRVYDANTGRLISFEINSNDDIAKRYFFGIGNGQTLYFYTDRDSIRFFNINGINGGGDYYFTTGIFDPFISKNKPLDTLYSKYRYPVRPLKPLKINDNKYLIVERDFETNRILFRYVDRHLKIIEEYLSESIGAPSFNSEVVGFDSLTGELLLRKRLIVEPPKFYSNCELFRFDSKANIIKKIYMKTDTYGWYTILNWKGSDKIAVIASNKNITDNYRIFFTLDILENNVFDSLVVGRKIIATDSLRSSIPWAFQEVNQNEWIMQWQESANYEKNGRFEFDYGARAVSTVRINKSSYGITTGNLEILKENKISVYPNPLTGEEIMISASDGFRGRMTFYDPLGRSVYSSAIDEQERRSYDVGHLKSGLYFILFEPDDRTFKRTTVRFVKF